MNNSIILTKVRIEYTEKSIYNKEQKIECRENDNIQKRFSKEHGKSVEKGDDVKMKRILGSLSVAIYTIGFILMNYCGKYLLETPYGDLGCIAVLFLLLAAVVLAGMLDGDYCSGREIEKWERELEELELALEKRRLELMQEK